MDTTQLKKHWSVMQNATKKNSLPRYQGQSKAHLLGKSFTKTKKLLSQTGSIELAEQRRFFV
jgi:hypothetical protein